MSAVKIDPQSLTWHVTPDLLGVLDSSGIFMHTNPAWFTTLGRTSEDIESRQFFDFLHPEDVAESEVEFAAIQKGKPVLGLVNRYRHSDGSYRWLSWNAVPEDGLFFCSARDVTEAMENAASLATREEEAKLREQFVAVLGHDLRNPVAAIDASLRLLMRQPQTDDALNTIALAQGSVRTMSSLISNLMDFARARLGDGIELPPLTAIAVEPLLRQAAEEIRLSHPEVEVTETYEFEQNVVCDGTRIVQMVANLLANAVTHGEKGAPISIRATGTAERMVIEVSNRGERIPDEALPTLFQPFARLNSKNARDGLGLGLFICSQIAQSHKGTLTVSSTDEATTFTFDLPTISAN